MQETANSWLIIAYMLSMAWAMGWPMHVQARESLHSKATELVAMAPLVIFSLACLIFTDAPWISELVTNLYTTKVLMLLIVLLFGTLCFKHIKNPKVRAEVAKRYFGGS